MITRLLMLVLLALSAGACAHPPVEAQAPAQAEQPVATVEEIPAALTPALPRQDLTQEMLYQFLLGEIAGQRGELKLASEAYMHLAANTRDARIAQRAMELAVYARRIPQATQAARLWLELEPGSTKARHTLVTMLVSAGRLHEARVHIDHLLKHGGPAVGETFLQLHSLLMRHPDKQAVLNLVEELAGVYRSVPEAHFAVAQAARQAGQYEQAAAALDEALRYRPGWEVAALYKGQLLARQGNEPVADFWKEFLANHPTAGEVRKAYARHLVSMGRYVEARAEFELLREASPGKADTFISLGLLSMQMNELDEAERYLMEALERRHPDSDQVKVYLGQLNEGRHKYEEALKWYQDVDRGHHHFDARLRAAIVLSKLNRVTEGRELLQALQPTAEKDQVRVVQTEAQMLRETNDMAGAYEVLSRGLQSFPDSPELLYDRAMAAEPLDRLEEVEKDLRRLIELQPDHAHAYNALGYTLVDRTGRYAEAIELLEKALKLAPDDPFILDSMGWAMFKTQRLDEAVNHLRRAYAARPDPEIAAHLGEALWVKGEREEAKRIWQGSIKDHPDNKSLRETVSRLQP